MLRPSFGRQRLQQVCAHAGGWIATKSIGYDHGQGTSCAWIPLLRLGSSQATHASPMAT
jgi:hypothetical protein